MASTDVWLISLIALIMGQVIAVLVSAIVIGGYFVMNKYNNDTVTKD